MKKQAFHFDLPSELIAQYPLANRSDSRLLTYNKATGQHGHHLFKQMSNFLDAGDLLVMNDSQVIRARLFGHKLSGGKVELLVERVINTTDFWAHIKSSKAPRIGGIIQLDQDWRLEVIDKQNDLYHCHVQNGEIYPLMEEIGHVPLPLYFDRCDDALDLNRYQTIYAREKGSVAAPTAGLHFDEQVFESLAQRGVEVGYVTLHVGAGTFRPVRCDNILEHKMHAEHCTVSEQLCAKVHATRALGKRVIAVGTTALRSLETAGQNGVLEPYHGDTDIFIYPGYEFKICDGLITNFHLPESTLIMLVAAFIGYEQAMNLYQIAIAARYRFYSYGDTSLLL